MIEEGRRRRKCGKGEVGERKERGREEGSQLSTMYMYMYGTCTCMSKKLHRPVGSLSLSGGVERLPLSPHYLALFAAGALSRGPPVVPLQLTWCSQNTSHGMVALPAAA